MRERKQTISLAALVVKSTTMETDRLTMLKDTVRVVFTRSW